MTVTYELLEPSILLGKHSLWVGPLFLNLPALNPPVLNPGPQPRPGPFCVHYSIIHFYFLTFEKILTPSNVVLVPLLV